MARRKLGMTAPDALGGFAYDFDIPDHGVLLFLVGEKGGPIHPGKIATNSFYRELDMQKIVLHPQDIGRFHTGCASARTFSRNRSGRAPGVSTSTSMPSSSLNSN